MPQGRFLLLGMHVLSCSLSYSTSNKRILKTAKKIHNKCKMCAKILKCKQKHFFLMEESDRQHFKSIDKVIYKLENHNTDKTGSSFAKE